MLVRSLRAVLRKVSWMFCAGLVSIADLLSSQCNLLLCSFRPRRAALAWRFASAPRLHIPHSAVCVRTIRLGTPFFKPGFQICSVDRTAVKVQIFSASKTQRTNEALAFFARQVFSG